MNFKSIVFGGWFESSSVLLERQVETSRSSESGGRNPGFPCGQVPELPGPGGGVARPAPC